MTTTLAALDGFPFEAVPDGTVVAPHHVYLGVLVALAMCRVVRDDSSDAEPWIVSNALYGVVFGFVLTWPIYPPVGAALSVVGVTVALGAGIVRPFWWGYRWRVRVPLVVGLTVAADDVLEHAFGVTTPLDWLWSEWLFPVVFRGLML